jgi:hypothetical protein
MLIEQPKGDLSVLLGTVPTYEPPQETEKNTIPKLPIENKHPYHIIVVAGQECPTPSGVPRGLGGVMKGMSVRVGHHKKKDKDKEENKKDEESDSSSSSDEEEQPARAASPLPPTPSGAKSQAQKGWSTMLDGMYLVSSEADDRLVLWTSYKIESSRQFSHRTPFASTTARYYLPRTSYTRTGKIIICPRDHSGGNTDCAYSPTSSAFTITPRVITATSFPITTTGNITT